MQDGGRGGDTIAKHACVGEERVEHSPSKEKGSRCNTPHKSERGGVLLFYKKNANLREPTGGRMGHQRLLIEVGPTLFMGDHEGEALNN